MRELKDRYGSVDREKHPNLPEYARTTPQYTDRTANGLTKCVIDFIRFTGGQAERINSIGRYVDKSQTYTDVLGHTRKIGAGKWLPSTGMKGTADISAVIQGLAVKIEVKIGKDQQSEAQKKYQKAIESAVGVYWLVRSFNDFRLLYDAL
ncbi:MAG: hypothetical protein RBT02_09800 [Bacteroidales bacterium]|nr:hypothetical protein [Bacteroidales bacterium]